MAGPGATAGSQAVEGTGEDTRSAGAVCVSTVGAVLAGGEAALAGGEAALAGDEAALAGGGVVLAGGEAVLAGGEAVLAGDEVVLAGGEAVLAGGACRFSSAAPGARFAGAPAVSPCTAAASDEAEAEEDASSARRTTWSKPRHGYPISPVSANPPWPVLVSW